MDKFTPDMKVYSYVKDLLDKPYFKRHSIDFDLFINIVEEWISFFEESIDQAVENTYLVFELTKNEMGYNAISRRWDWPGKQPNRYTKDDIKAIYKEKFIACISHLYQGFPVRDTGEYHGGAIGLLIVCSFTVSFVESEYKRVDKIAVSDISMGLEIKTGKHSEIDVYSDR